MDEIFIFVELRQKSFDKYVKARTDVDKPGWFKCSNRILDDDDLHDFSAAELCAWLHIMSLSSQQQSPRVRINLEKSDALRRKFTRQDLQSAIAKLTAIGILRDTSTLRPRDVDVTQRGEDRIGEDQRGEEPTTPADETFPGEDFGIAPELAGNSKREQVLPTVPLSTQREWLEKYDPGWLKESLVRAIDHYSKGKTIAEVDWPDRLGRWFSQERKPKLRPKPKPDRVKDPPSPWPTGKDNVLRDPRLQQQLSKVMSR